MAADVQRESTDRLDDASGRRLSPGLRRLVAAYWVAWVAVVAAPLAPWYGEVVRRAHAAGRSSELAHLLLGIDLAVWIAGAALCVVLARRRHKAALAIAGLLVVLCMWSGQALELPHPN